ncbi:MAG: DUF1015 domain-containing protein [Phycisphaeraceae bacterium]|nr:DUF1015 domain-containing protein [Phycisphaeraceae bacterium]
MIRVHPFPALRPIASRAAEVACEPYDVVTTAEARALADGRPASFLRVVRSEIELDPSIDPHSTPVYEHARRKLGEFCDQGILLRDDAPSFYVYRLSVVGRRQAGLVACMDVEDYRSGRIRIHEKTRPDKEDDRVRHILTTRTHAEPVLLAARGADALNSLLSADMNERPLYHFVARDGVTHSLWRSRHVAEYVDAFRELGVVYVADGHHRSAAADRVAREVDEGRAPAGQGEEHRRFPAVIFPAEQLVILPYHRVVKDLNGHSAEAFLEHLRNNGSLTPTVHPDPDSHGKVCVYLAHRAEPGPDRGRWYQWQPAPQHLEGRDAVARLDVSLLQDLVLAPALGIQDPRRDARIGFVGGSVGTAELMGQVDSGAAAVAFSMFATSMDELLAVAEAHQIMPPKSTWFHPKLRSGLFMHSF